MQAFVERLNIGNVENGFAGDEAQFLFRTWRENDGFIVRNRGMSELSTKLLLLKPQAKSGDVPPVVFMGKNTTFRRFFPQAAFSERPPTSFLPREYRQGVAEGYHAVLQGEVWYDTQRTGTLLGDGVPDLTLDRLILNFRTETGSRRLFCLMTLQEVHQQFVQSDRKHRRRNFPPELSSHPAYQARAQPTGSHGNAPV